MNILEQLKKIDDFSDAEQHVIHYLLTFPENIVNLSIKDLAKLSNTSTSTVTRLVNKLNNNKGYSHFKAIFFSEINTMAPSKENDSSILASDTTFSILNKIAVLQTDAIEKTRQSINRVTLTRVFTLLNNSNKIEFYGFDDNLHMVKYHLSRLMSLGKQVIIHDSTNAQFFQAYSSTKDDVAIVVSRTGTNRRLLEIIDILRLRKTKLIIMTPDRQSPIAKHSTEWLQVEDDPNSQLFGNITFETSLQYILNVIFSLFYSKNQEQNKALFEAYGMLWKDKL